MSPRNLGKDERLVLVVFVVFTRGLPGWENLLAGDPSAEWLPSVTLAFLWGTLILSGLPDTVPDPSRGFRELFAGENWAGVALLLALPATGLAFLSIGYDLVTVGIDILGGLLVLVLWLLVGTQMLGGDRIQQT
jgi:hypothetical protein